MWKILCLISFITIPAKAQKTESNNYFSAPLSIPLSLTGNFCEVRNNHFHSGLDLRTQGKEGLPVFATASGFISRIKISAVGYGKAIYITHPNGTVSVYGHLRMFADSIQQYVELNQHKREFFEIELFPDSTLFPVLRGELIALSGNSGGSQAPHLHFEIRDRYTEEPLNPLLHGFVVTDTVFPVFNSIGVYQYEKGVFTKIVLADLIPLNDSVYACTDTIRINSSIDSIAVAFSAYDKALAPDSNELGIYTATLISKSDTVYHYAYNRFNFSDTRYVNAHIDYETKITHNIELERCYTLPGDSFPLFRNAGKGIIVFNDSVLDLKLIIRDINGNTSTLLLEIAKIKDQILTQSKSTIINFKEDQTLKTKHASLIILKGNLYQNIINKKMRETKNKKFLSPVISVFDKTVPLHKGAELCIDIINVPLKYRQKALVAQINDYGMITGSANGILNRNKIKTTIRSFGNYAITIDTIAPIIDDFQLGYDSISLCNFLSLKIKDDLSGIENYNGTIDHKWNIMEYDAKTDKLICYLPKKFFGPHYLKIEVTDKRKNKTLYQNYF